MRIFVSPRSGAWENTSNLCAKLSNKVGFFFFNAHGTVFTVELVSEALDSLISKIVTTLIY